VAAELKDALSVESRLIEGTRGIFDVKVDGKLVYSKHKTHTFPEVGEVVQLIRRG
jgi:selT/selW/selH-like putative selenoprotein